MGLLKGLWSGFAWFLRAFVYLFMALALIALVGVGAALLIALVSSEPLDTTEVARLQEPPRSSGAQGVSPQPRYELLELGGPASSDDVLVFLAFSGGGKRSSAFSYGVLEGMRDMDVPAGAGAAPGRFLDMIDMVTGVSGGSFTAASLALRGDAIFDDYVETFLYDQTEDRIAGLYLLPWNWHWLLSAEHDRSDAMAGIFDDLLFQGATYRDLSEAGRPMAVLGATDVVLGNSFVFTQRQFDLLCGDLNPLPVSIAVAASNGFPGLFSPISLNTHDAPCNHVEPDWLRPLSQSRFGALEREAEVADDYRQYLDPDIRYVHLMDGGIADNLALRGLLDAIILFNSIERLPAESEYLGIRRVLVVSVDGEAAISLDQAGRDSLSGLLDIISIVSGTQIDRYNHETLLLGSLVLEEFEDQLVNLRCNTAPVIDGHSCHEVDTAFVHLSLNDIEDDSVRQQLSSIPTGLSLAPDDVDALIAVGRDSVMGSAEIRRFILGLGD